jgi:hypothetical protein
MFRRTDRTRLDRILAAIEIPALGLWLGALCGFAFIFAPAAFHTVTDLTQFAALTSANLRALALVGSVCGGLTIIIALVRSREAADRTNDIVRATLVAVALCFITYEMLVIVPAMAAIPDLRSDAYHQLHGQSTAVYGGAVLAGLVALVLAAIRSDS